MPRVILHVGAHKTGTSAVQLFMEEERDWLAERGLHVPLAGQMPGGGHHLLARALTGFGSVPDRDSLLSELEQESIDAGRPDLLISSEMLAKGLRKPDLLRGIVDYFRTIGYDITVIYFIRSETSGWNSAYSQMVKNLHLDAKFADFVDSRIASLPIDPEKSYEELAQPDYSGPRPLWAALQLQPTVEGIFKPYNADIRKLGSVASVLEAAGVKDKPPANKRGVNKSPGPTQIFVCRRFAEWMAINGQSFADRQRRRLTDIIDGLPFGDDRPFSGVTPEIAERIELELADRRNRFAEAIWNLSWEECFPGEGVPKHAANDLDLLATSEIDWDRINALETQVQASWRDIKRDAESKKFSQFTMRQINKIKYPFSLVKRALKSSK